MSRHFELVDAVNDAATAREHELALAYLRGWREGKGIDGFELMQADLYSMDKHGEDADMTCGVLFGWKPKPVQPPAYGECNCPNGRAGHGEHCASRKAVPDDR